MADEIVEEVVEEVEEEVVEESAAKEAKTKIEVNIEFSADELASLVSSIADAPTGGYQNVTKNKTVYSLPTKKLAVKVAEKINEAFKKALRSACDKFDEHAETMQGLRDDLTKEATTRGDADKNLQTQIHTEVMNRQNTDKRLDNLLADVETKSRDVAQNEAATFLEEERGIRTEQIQAILDRVGVAAKSSTEPGIASLNESGQIPASQLPSYIDDVIEGYLESKTYFRGPDAYLVEPERSKIYFDTNTGLCYRWSGSEFVVISSPVELGTGVGQAYPGNMGQTLADKVLQLESSECVKPTDIATAGKAGIVKANSMFGISSVFVDANGTLSIMKATNAEIDQKTNVYNPIVPANLDHAVVQVLTNYKGDPLTDEQLQAFYKWIGAVQYYYEARNGIARFINGQLIVNTPIDSTHATNKAWVEQHVAAETKNIREALDLAEITETVEVTDKYNSRQTANGLTLYPNQPTTLLKVEGDTITTINRLDLSSVNNSILEITENGKKITAIANGSYMSSQIGVLQDLCPTIHIGDVVYLYCKDGTSVLPNGLVDANNNVIILVNTATTITAEMLATTVHLGVIPFMQGFVIEDLQITKVQNAPWTPYFKGLKNAEFAGIVSTGVNLVNIPDIEGALSTMHFVDRYVFDPFSFETGDYTLSAYFQSEYDGDIIRLNIFEYDKDGNRGNLIVFIGSDSNKKSRQSGVAHLKKGKIYKIVSTYGSSASSYAGNVYITNIQFQIGTTATEYTPYIEPTKYAFPNTVNPLGRTIDFENKKIVDYGITVELDGTENWNYYTAKGSFVNNSGNGVVLDGFIPVSVGNVRRLPGIATDGTVEIETDITSDTGFQAGKIWLGIDGRGLYWTGILDMLGFTTKGVEPTDDEKATAIASFKAYLAQRYADGNPVTIRYVATSVQSETPFTEAQTAAGNSYIPYTGGTETVDNANAELDLENTVTQEYDIVNKIGG